MGRRRYGGAVVVVALLGLLGGCGGDAGDTTSDDAAAATGSGADDIGAGDDAEGADAGAAADTSSDGAVPAAVTVDGQTYSSTLDLAFEGGACTINDPDRPGRDFVAYFAESGERVELSFLSGPDIEGSSDDVFRGSLSIGADGAWSIESLDPWPWTGADGSTGTVSLTMEDLDGSSAEVTIDVTCP